MGKKKLTAEDYMTRDKLELQSHPDFNEQAFEVIRAVKAMDTRELELLWYSIF